MSSDSYSQYDCGCAKKKDTCPKVPKDCFKFCLKCLPCTFPEIYARVVCCVDQAIAKTVELPAATEFGSDSQFALTLAGLPVADAPGVVTQDVLVTRSAAIQAGALLVRDQLLAQLDKACCCIKGKDEHWHKGKDACQKEAVIKAMADIVCCYFETGAAFRRGVFQAAADIATGLPVPDDFDSYLARLNAADATLLADTQARLAELTRCVCGCPPEKKEVVCCACKDAYH